MIINSNKIEDSEVIQSDICVVGAGVAGITFAREFNNTNVDVVLLESGTKDPDNDEANSLIDGRSIGVPYNKLNGRMRALGGSSHLWFIPLPDNSEGLRLRGLDPIDFEKREWIPYSGWPITKNELDSYYTKAHKLLEIGPYRYDAEYWANKKSYPQLAFSEDFVKTTIFHFAKKEIFTSKLSKELEESKNIQVYLNATALNVHLKEEANQVKHILATNLANNKFKIKAKYFILASGGIETPRLLMLSRDIIQHGVGNQNDLVGRFFMEHPHLKSGYYYPSEPDFFNQATLYEIHKRDENLIAGKLALTEKTIRKEKLLNFTAGLHHTPMVGLEETDSAVMDLAKAMKSLKIPEKIGPDLKTILKYIDLVGYVSLRKILKGDKDKWYDTKYKYHGYRLEIMSEQLPDPESRVMLDDRFDRFGQNQVKLKWKLNPEDIHTIKRSQEIIDRELRKSKLGKLDIELKDESIPDNMTGGWHHMGTTRMSSDPKQGVVDENCSIHGVQNLFVAGPSVFPTSGYANPVLTIVALSIRLADHLKIKL